MVKTGYISFLIETGGGFDSNGNPIAATKTPTLFVPCNLSVVNKEYKSLVDQQYLQAAYKIIVDNKEVDSFNLVSLTEVRLQDLRNNDLGTFQLQDKQFLSLTNQLKIVV